MMRNYFRALCTTGALMASALTLHATTYYVNGSSGEDGNPGTSSSSAKKTIQAAVSSASSGDTILVSAGQYSGDIVINKKLTIKGADGAKSTTITGTGNTSVMYVTSSAGGTTIEDLTITGGYGYKPDSSSNNTYGGAIEVRGADATIKSCIMHGNGRPYFGGAMHSTDGANVSCTNCLFYSNSCQYAGGAYLVEAGSVVTLQHCTVYNNSDDYGYGALCYANTGRMVVKNSIIWGNSKQFGSFLANGGSITVSYSCVQDGYTGTGNISTDPKFVDAANGDFSLQVTSPCIDTGDPSSNDADGTRVDMGFTSGNIASGNTGGGNDNTTDLPRVTGVTAKQRYPWNGMVDITCTVSGISGMTNDLKFSVVAVNSGNVYETSQFWVVKDGMRSTDHAVHTNGTYHLVWDSKVAFDKQICSNMVMRVNLAVLHEKVQLWEGGPYWATMNIGAEEPYEFGYYFWWGDTVGYRRVHNVWVASDGSSASFSFGQETTPTYGNGYDNATLQGKGWVTADGVLAPEHDAAHVQWGGGGVCRQNRNWTTLKTIATGLGRQ